MRIKLTELPKHSELIGKTINVQCKGGQYHYDYQDKERLRVFQGAKITKENKENWVKWYWQPQREIDDNDCGWSGIRITNNNFIDTYYLEV